VKQSRPSKTSGRSIEIAERIEQILELKKRGLTLAAIGERVGLAPSTVHQHIKKALEELNEKGHENIDRWRRLESERLEVVIREAFAVFEAASDRTVIVRGVAHTIHDMDSQLKAIETIRKATMDQAKLWGAFTAKVDVSGAVGVFDATAIMQKSLEYLHDDRTRDQLMDLARQVEAGEGAGDGSGNR